MALQREQEEEKQRLIEEEKKRKLEHQRKVSSLVVINFVKLLLSYEGGCTFNLPL